MYRSSYKIWRGNKYKGYIKYNNEEKNDVKGYKILDKIDNANLYNDEDTSFIIAIKNNKTRQEIADKFQEFDYYTVIHPKTHIGENVSIGKGSIIMDEVNIKR